MDEILNVMAIGELEEAELEVERPRRIFHARDDPFEILSDRSFIRTYRVTKEIALNVCELVTPFIPDASRKSALDIRTKVLIALNFFGYGSYQLNIGQNINFAVSQSSVCRAIWDVTRALNRPEIFDNFVHFPRTLEELRQLRNGFYEKYQFPGVIGCIDCTHVAICPPPKNDPVYPEHIYINRKGYHSINTQLHAIQAEAMIPSYGTIVT